VADEIDQAAEHSALRLNIALKNHYAAREAADGCGICIDCEEPIPDERIRALPGCRRCIECQQRYESRMNGR
jgi:phage/conjugal plasmid C-4 type zinc finger TraR family protein